MRFGGNEGELRMRFSVTRDRLETGAVTLLAIAFGLLCAASVAAGDRVWTSQGPSRGAVRDLAVDPADGAVAYAATDGGVFRTADGEAAWTPVNNGPPRPGRSPSPSTPVHRPTSTLAPCWASTGARTRASAGRSPRVACRRPRSVT